MDFRMQVQVCVMSDVSPQPHNLIMDAKHITFNWHADSQLHVIREQTPAACYHYLQFLHHLSELIVWNNFQGTTPQASPPPPSLVPRPLPPT